MIKQLLQKTFQLEKKPFQIRLNKSKK